MRTRTAQRTPEFGVHWRGLRFSLPVLLALVFTINALAVPAQSSDPSPEKLIKTADKLFRQASFAEAEKVLRDVIAAEPDNIDAKLRIAHLQIKRRQLLEGYRTSFDIASADPKNTYALSVVGTALLSAGNFAEARPLFYRAIQLNKREALAWAGIGMIDYYENRVEEAVLNLREAVHHEPTHSDHVFALAQIAARAEYYKEAADAYDRFLSLSREPDDERRARIKGLISFLRFLGNRASLYNSAGKETTKVAFDLVGNRPVLKVRVNGRKEVLNFILDTGSGITVLSQETADRLRIKPVTRGGYARGIGGDGKFEIVYGFLREIELGDVRVKNVPVYIRKFHSENYRVDGYIGLSLISKFLTTVDYGELTFSLDRKEDTPPITALDKRSLPLRLTSSGFLSGEVRLDGLPDGVNFIVDTGASVSVISNDLAAVEAISAAETGERMRVIGAAGVTENVRSYLLPRVAIGDNARSKITAVALDLDLINEASGFEQGGILGGNFLRSYRLTFDFKNSRVTFDPVEERPQEVVTPLE